KARDGVGVIFDKDGRQRLPKLLGDKRGSVSGAPQHGATPRRHGEGNPLAVALSLLQRPKQQEASDPPTPHSERRTASKRTTRGQLKPLRRRLSA
ncbi:MAG: hypothetical protein R3268_07215, partial [Acidiferrobacterales bacterium]|nr:hypothetical protein [Acidiferrobacterales bacterium]